MGMACADSTLYIQLVTTYVPVLVATVIETQLLSNEIVLCTRTLGSSSGTEPRS